MESDVRKFGDLMSLVEEGQGPLAGAVNADDEEDDVSLTGNGSADPSLDVDGGNLGGNGNEFGADDFSMDTTNPTATGDFTADFGGNFGGGDMGGAPASGDVNADAGASMGGEEEEEFVQFRDKNDWLQSSLDTMQKLVSQSVGQQMQKGNGVILTSDEILNGTQGIRNDLPRDIVDKFLKIYPELDTELTMESLDEIEEKLSLNDGQFDAWLQENLPELTGQSDVDETLNNDMFMSFEPMGGENVGGEPQEQLPASPDDSMEFGDLLDEYSEEGNTPEYLQAANQVDGMELNEFPNIDGGALPPEEEEAPIPPQQPRR